MTAVLAAGLTGCGGGTLSADRCAAVAVPLSDIPTRTDQEPRMRIPVPTGWERNTAVDSESIRFAIRNNDLAADGFKPNAVVTLQQVPLDVGKPEQILAAQNDQLSKKLRVTDLTSTATQVCGSPAMSTSYTAPEVDLSKRNPKAPKIPARTATSLGVVFKSGDANYVATLTVQTVRPDDPTYQQDSADILKGFQLLPPG
jgi:hypothetical protein